MTARRRGEQIELIAKLQSVESDQLNNKCKPPYIAMDDSIVLFGSCNRQNLPQHHWDDMLHSQGNIHGFLWLGDSVYPANHSVDTLVAAYSNLTSNAKYTNFIAEVGVIDGILDDHDFGVNDGGRTVDNIETRRTLFYNFLHLHLNHETDHFTSSDMLYHSTKIMPNVNVIFLDTRTYRDDHYVKSIGNYHFPFTALIAAAVRGFCGVFKLGSDYNGDILGESQWKWLENELKVSDSDFNIIVSSIQIMTSNPMVESWGHFPSSKRRLFNLVEQYNPRGLLFLSGDVHHSEISTVKKHINNDESIDVIAEITSSGLTHHCGNILCPLMLNVFNGHRKSSGDYYIGKNYGSIRKLNETALSISIHSLHDHKTKLSYVLHGGSRLETINLIKYSSFPTIYDTFVLPFVILLCTIIIFCKVKK